MVNGTTNYIPDNLISYRTHVSSLGREETSNYLACVSHEDNGYSLIKLGVIETVYKIVRVLFYLLCYLQLCLPYEYTRTLEVLD